MKRNFFVNILIAFVPIVVVAVVGTLFVNNGMDWMTNLNKPSEWVPNFLIPIVWSVIYLSTAIIIYLWIRKNDMPVNIAILFLVNGILNILWCLLFFQLHLIFVGLVAIILNLIFAILLWVSVYRTRKTFAYILAIYPVWLCIATTLNLALWILN